MKKKITILSGNVTEERLLLHTNESIKGLTPREQILVDSENYAFIYIMENSNDYIYIEIPEMIWPLLKKVLDQKLAVSIIFEDQEICLTNFDEELEYIIHNIKGNSNYGEEMVTKVEAIF